MQKEHAAEIFDIKLKHVHKFSLETPEKNKISGFISKSRGSKMGSLIIEYVNGKETLQYVQGMPKLQYLDERDELSLPVVLDKADGTNVVHFPLIDHQGNVIETLFKTRMMPSCQNKFQKLVDQVITENHFRAVEKTKLSYSYELYGYENQHEVNYRFLDIPLQLELITILDQGYSLPYMRTLKKAMKYKIEPLLNHWCVSKIPDRTGFNFAGIHEFLEKYGDFSEGLKSSFNVPTLEGAYKELEVFYEKINMNYQKEHHGGIITEGSVWHFGEEENHMKKNKAISVREGHIKQACGIPEMDIRKAIMKAKENGHDLEDRNERGVIFEFIKEELLEEYSKEMVEDHRVPQKFNSIITKMTRKFKIDEKMASIVRRINDEASSDASPADKMRVFSELYPDLRKMSNKVYQTVVSM